MSTCWRQARRLPGSVSGLMQSVGRRYVGLANKTYRRSGTLFKERFKSSLVDSERYLLTCLRYIELNPVRADIVSTPGDYWPSYRAHVGESVFDWLAEREEYPCLGANRASCRTILLIVVAALAFFGYSEYSHRIASLTADAVPSVHQAASSVSHCDGRIHCSPMTSCSEPTFFLGNCPNVQMDGDLDGVPCEQQWCTNPLAK